MITQSWMYHAILYVYALSLLFFFFDFLQGNRSAKRMGAGFLFLAWALQCGHLILLLFSYENIGEIIYTKSMALFLFSWMLTLLSLLLDRFFHIELFVFLTGLLGFMVLLWIVMHSVQIPGTKLEWNINPLLLILHISMAVAGYAAFAASAVLSAMHLFVHRSLKQKRWSLGLKRLPSLDKTERYAVRAVITGVPLLLSALALGITWIVLQGNMMMLLDTKVLVSVVILAFYLYFLFLRYTSRAVGPLLAYLNIGTFVLVLFNLIGMNGFTSFHEWGWMK